MVKEISKAHPIVLTLSSILKKSPNKEQKESKRKPKLTMVVPEKFLLMRQTDAAYQLGFSPSTFSKRWRTSLPNRKWPYRKHSKVNNAIKALRAMQKKGHSVDAELEKLVNERNENSRPAVIHYCDKDIMDRDSQAILAGRPSPSSPSSPSSASSLNNSVSSPSSSTPSSTALSSSAGAIKTEMDDDLLSPGTSHSSPFLL